MVRPLLAGAALFALGCLLADGDGRPGEVWALLALAALLLVSAPIVRRTASSRWALAAAAVGLGAAAAQVEFLGFEATPLRRRLAEAEAADRSGTLPVRLVGVARGDAFERAGRLVLVVDVQQLGPAGAQQAVVGRARIDVGGALAKPRILDGERVALWAKLYATRRSEGVRDGLSVHGVCKSVRLLERLGPGDTGWLRRLGGRLREAARRSILKAVAPGPERGLVLAMALGDRSEVDEATSEAFRASGTYHVLALSGAQVALVAGLVVALLRFWLVPPWLQALLTTATIGAYAAFVGGDLPVVRAVLMAAALLLGRALELDTDAANLLGLAAFVLLVDHPACLHDVGFQLSFGATLGILVLVTPLVRGWPKLPLRIELLIAASIAAQAALAPILAASFHRLAPAAVVLNLAAVPLSTAVLVSGLAVVAASLAGSGPAGLVGAVAFYAARALRLSGDLGPLGSWLDLRVAGPSLGLIALDACGLALLARGRRGAGLLLLAAVHVLMLAGPLRPHADGRLHLTVIDVGAGDSLLLRSPTGRAILVDAGGGQDQRFDPGERRVAPQLWDQRLRGLDVLVVSHAHADHVRGARYLLRAFAVAEIWEGPAAPSDAAWKEAAAIFAKTGATRRTVAAGMAMDWDGVRLSVLGPKRPAAPLPRVRNEDSVVIEVVFRDVRLLLTGDVGGAGERSLALRPADVLKVPHHGSRTSSSPAFVAAVEPRVAIVSTGPLATAHPEVLERYRRVGALVLRTDRDGTIEVATDGQRLWVRTAAEGCERRMR